MTDDQARAETPATTPPAEPPAQPPVRNRRRLFAVLGATALVALVLDQVTKAWAIAELTGRGRVDVVGDLFGFRLIRNSGAAFSLLVGNTWVLTILALIIVAVIIRYSRRLGSGLWAVTLGLLIGGACGNLVDRFLRAPGFARGHVVDFLELPHWPIFNIADTCVVTGALLVAYLGLRGVGVDGTVIGKEDGPAGTAGDAAPR